MHPIVYIFILSLLLAILSSLQTKCEDEEDDQEQYEYYGGGGRGGGGGMRGGMRGGFGGMRGGFGGMRGGMRGGIIGGFRGHPGRFWGRRGLWGGPVVSSWPYWYNTSYPYYTNITYEMPSCNNNCCNQDQCYKDGSCRWISGNRELTGTPDQCVQHAMCVNAGTPPEVCTRQIGAGIVA